MSKTLYWSNIILTFFVVAGSFVVAYFQYIDGSLVRKPITFGVDIKNLQTQHEMYRPGETVRLKFSFCRHRSYELTSNWKIVNATIVFFPEVRLVVTPACIEDKYVEIGHVPFTTVPGPHHMEGTSAVKVNNLRTIYIDYRSEEFQVI